MPTSLPGLSEPMTRARFKTGFKVYRAGYAENDAARAERRGMGLVKLMVGRSGKILGAGVVGGEAGELVALLGLAIAQKLDAARLAELSAPHPAYADLLRALGEQVAADRGLDRRLQRRFALNRLLG